MEEELLITLTMDTAAAILQTLAQTEEAKKRASQGEKKSNSKGKQKKP